MLTLVRRQPQQPRARFAPRSTPRFARRPRQRFAAHAGLPSPPPALVIAVPVTRLRTVLRMSASAAARYARTTPDTRADPRDGAPAEPAVTTPVTASRSALRTAGHSIAVAAPIRRLHRRRSSDLSYSANRLSDRPGRPWVPHPTQQAAGGAHAPSPRALRRPPPPLAAWLLLERAYVAPIHAKYRGPDRAGRRMSYTDMRPQRDRTRHKHGPIHDRHTAFYGCGGAPADVFHGRYTVQIVEFAPIHQWPRLHPIPVTKSPGPRIPRLKPCPLKACDRPSRKPPGLPKRSKTLPAELRFSARGRRAPWPAMNRGRHALTSTSQRLRHSDNQTRVDRPRNCPRIVPSRAPFRPLEGAET